MKKNEALPAVLLFVLLFSALAGALPFGKVQALTNVSGIINSDTTWTKADSPYNLSGPVLVNNGVTLTIEPGATVNLNSYYILVNGTLRAQGTASDMITIKGGGYNAPNWGLTFSSFSSNWNETDESGCVIENTVLNVTYTSINNSPKITNNVIVGNLIGEGGSPLISNNNVSGSINNGGSGSPVIANNNIAGSVGKGGEGSIIIRNNTIKGPIMTPSSRGPPYYYGNAIFLSGNVDASILGNSISGYFDDTAISLNGGTPTVEWNTISNSYGSGSGYFQGGFKISSGTRASIQNNTITKNAMGIYCESDLVTMVYNNILGNSNYNIYLRSVTNNVNATYNWWGTTDTQAINQTIYDFKNDFNLGKVNFTPLLTKPNLAAPPIPAESSATPTPPLTASPTPPLTATPTLPPTQSLSPSPSTTQSSTPLPSLNPTPSSSQNPTPSPATPQNEFSGTATAIIIVLIVTVAVLSVALLLVLKRKKQ